MGVKISIDKHLSDLDDILDMSPHYINRVQFESHISPDITNHLKVQNLSLFIVAFLDFVNNSEFIGVAIL